MSQKNLSLPVDQLFALVTQTLSQHKETLNQADTYNHDHGDHVVEVFELVTQVAKEHPDAEPAEILALASQRLREQPTGTARVYAETMAETAKSMQGKPLNVETIPLLLQGLLGVQQPQESVQEQGGGGLADVLGGLLGGGQSQAPGEGQGQGDLLGGLMGALLGGGQGQSGGGLSDGLDAGDLLRAGMAFLQDKQAGGSGFGAALQTLLGNSQVAQTPHRAQSAQLIATALLQAAQQLQQGH